MSRAEKRMLFGIHHNAHMSLPHNQIARLRVADTQELSSPPVKIQGADVGIAVSGLLVQAMHQVRAIRRETLFVVRPRDPLCDGSPFAQAEKAETGRYYGCPRRLCILYGSLFHRLAGSLFRSLLTSSLFRRRLTSSILTGILTRSRLPRLAGSLFPYWLTLLRCVLLPGRFCALLP